MTTNAPERSAPRDRPLAGRTAWIFSDGKAGHEIQCRGVAEALGVHAEIKRVAPSGLARLTAPWGLIPSSDRVGRPGSPLAAPWPDVALAIGRTTIPYIRALKRHAGAATFTVILLDPKIWGRAADLFWVPEHDRRRGANVMTTLTAPHLYHPSRLAALRAACPPAIAALARPRVAVLVGGPNGDFTYDAAACQRLVAALASLSAEGASLLITSSRRTPASLIADIEAATRTAPRLMYAGTGDNPYPDFLAQADAFLVTADSVNMAGEAAATGKPIHIFHPSGGSAKFARYHAALATNGITRPWTDKSRVTDQWTYTPLDSARVIADEIGRRWQALQSEPAPKGAQG
ncbi:MAG: mitochondrial fission ELM1 family protein [Hyphomicrobium sp.]